MSKIEITKAERELIIMCLISRLKWAFESDRAEEAKAVAELIGKLCGEVIIPLQA